MKMICKTKLVVTLILALFISTAYAKQPYEEIQTNPRVYFVPQVTGASGIATCGPTSFYMMLKFFDFQAVFEPDESDPRCPYWYCPLSCPAALNDAIHYPSKVSLYSRAYRYLAKNQWDCLIGGASISTLEYAARKLKYNDGTKALNTTQKYTTRTKDPAIKAAQLNIIKSGYLDHNAPVIIHLSRKTGVGHYIVIAGYHQGYVYFLDPNEGAHGQSGTGTCIDSDCLLQKIPYTNFINDSWYINSGLGDGYWDATWAGFRP